MTKKKELMAIFQEAGKSKQGKAVEDGEMGEIVDGTEDGQGGESKLEQDVMKPARKKRKTSRV